MLVVTVATVVMVAACSLGDAESSTAPSAPPSGQTPTESAGTSPDPTAGSAVDAEGIEHAGNSYLVVTLPLEQWDVSVEWDPEDRGTMLRDAVAEDPTIAVATNGGIFTPELVPGGLLVADGVEMVPLNLSEGAGNFHLMPNAVFAVYEDGHAAVVNSVDYNGEGVMQATQSGPALILDGDVHPAFNEGSSNLAVRSGVGVSPEGDTVYLAISWSFTNLWDFATLFRDELGVEDALYLDGDISTLWIESMDEPGPVAGPYAGIITARERS
ncbi:phosphodiester glycosidase family protein [Demequina sediminicola]|uniref:phosphodiester glycosidase family protein n=1 Tax=Demequina sediminicola TaxID=1095026 RepID=UPI00078342E5|nr:phosphodiester glycosidase family protein [Demequina sediminicola]